MLTQLKTPLVAGEIEKEVEFFYTNWRGKASKRKAIPISIWYGRTEWHTNEQWFVKATDLDKGEIRDFALVDMKFSNLGPET